MIALGSMAGVVDRTIVRVIDRYSDVTSAGYPMSKEFVIS